MIRRALNRAASHVDVVVGKAIFHRSAASRARSSSESLGHDDRMIALAEMAAIYDVPAHYDPDGPFFPPPSPITPRKTFVRSIAGGEVSDWTWPSGFSLHCEAVADRYMTREENHLAAARLFLHGDRPRPTALLLHGYRAGQYAVEEAAWPIRWLFERGLDVAIFVLPFHGVRAKRLRAPLFPGSDPRITNEGFRQSVLDARTLIHHLLDVRGAPAVGVMGMSLGGYTASLLATLEPRLSFVVPLIPLSSIADVADRLGRFVGTDEQKALQRAGLDRVHRVVSPLARAPRVSRDRVLIAAAEGDTITPPAHAEKLGAHFGRAPLMFSGGHILQLGRRDAFRAIGKMLGELGMLDARG